MSEKKFNSIVTTAGLEKFAAAALSGEKVGFSFMAIGDGGGVVPTPEVNQTGLINEVYRSSLNTLDTVAGAENVIEAEMIIPPQAGGFVMREAALFDDDGACLVVANMPETYKPMLDEGSGRFSVIRIQIAVTSSDIVQLINDPGIVVATVEDVISVRAEVKDYADEQLSEHEKSRNHPDASLTEKGFTQLSSSLDSDREDKAATPKAVKAVYSFAGKKTTFDTVYPVGIVAWLADSKNPNILWPGTTWVYLGENKTIRLGKQDGSDVRGTGGSDTITIGKDNLPNVQIDITGTAADTDLGTITTKGGGAHGHKGKFQEQNTSIDGGASDRRGWSPEYDENGEELIIPVDEHTHEAEIGPHGHNVSGKTAALGAGSSINITNSYINLMGWYRTA